MKTPPKSRPGVKVDGSQRHLALTRERTGGHQLAQPQKKPCLGSLHLLKSEKDFSQGQIKTEVLSEVTETD